VLVDDPPVEVAVGAIGKVWKPEIPFVHVADAAAFAAFDQPDFVRSPGRSAVERRGPTCTASSSNFVSTRPTRRRGRKFRTYFL
jgi:hypothetical protein